MPLKLLVGAIDHSDLRGDDRATGERDNITLQKSGFPPGTSSFISVHRADDDPLDLFFSFSPSLSLSRG